MFFNTSLFKGEYPSSYKYETSTPVPKKYPVKHLDQIRNISGIITSDKIFEKSDVSQFGNAKENSIQP